MKILTTTAFATLAAARPRRRGASAEIRIGATVSETGPAAFLGDPEAKTLKMLVEKLNAAGGINGEEIALTLYDDGGDPNKARTFATRLVEDDEVVAIIGGTTTGTTMSIIPVAEDAEIPFISLAGAIEIIDPVKEWVFKTPHTDRMACQKIFEDMKAQWHHQDRHDLRHRRLRRLHARAVPRRGRRVRHRGRRRRELRPDRRRHDPAAHQHQEHRRHPGRAQPRLRPGPVGRHPQLPAARRRPAALPEPRRRLQGLHRARRPRGRRGRPPPRHRAPRRPTSSPTTTRRSRSSRPTSRSTRRPTARRPPPSAATPTTPSRSSSTPSTRAGSAEPEAIRDAIEETAGLAGTTGVVTMTPEDHLGFDLSAFRMLEIKDGGWTLVE